MGFKVGDWVNCIHNSKPPYLLKTQDEVDEQNRYCEYEYELWKPKQGEWVCFKGTDISFTIIQWESNWVFNAAVHEPFIGELPTFIEEN